MCVDSSIRLTVIVVLPCSGQLAAENPPNREKDLKMFDFRHLQAILLRSRGALAVLLLASWVFQTACEDGGGEPTGASRVALEELAQTLNRTTGLARATYLADVLAAAGDDDRARIRALFEQGRLPHRQLDLALIAVDWAERDPQAAYEWVSRMEAGSRPPVLRIWARAEPEAALRSAIEVRGELRGRCLAAVAQGWYDSGRPGLEEFIRGLDPYDENDVIASLVTQVGSTEGSEGLMAWSEAFTLSARGKLTLYRKTALTLGRTDPPFAKEWIARHAEGPHGSNLIKLAAIAWAGHDGSGAFEWLETLPESGERAIGVEEGFRRWYRNDPDAAGDWLRAAGFVPWLEPAHVIYSTRLTDGDPLAAIEWAKRISGDSLRERAIFRIVRRWRFSDESAARAWVDAQSDLSPALVERLLAPIGRQQTTG